jgi:threonine synthase
MSPADAAAGKITLACVRCGRTFPWSFTVQCPACGGLVDIDYDLRRARIGAEGPPLDRYFDLLPLTSREHVIDGGEGNTPCRHAAALGRALGLRRLYVKIEGANPTRTTKDRQGTQAVATFRDLGIRDFVTSSTGNSCTALARIVSRFPDMTMSVFVGDEFIERLNWSGAPNVKVFWLPEGSFVDAHAAARWYAEQSGATAERGFFFFGKREALKVAYLEAVEQIGAPIECYVQGVSSAMGVYATWKGARQLQALGRIARPPRLVCVQEETCDPMVRAWRRGGEAMIEDDVVRSPRGLSKATLRGDSRGVYAYVRVAVQESGGTMVVAEQDAMRAMRDLVRETEGLDVCFTSAMTAVAAADLRRAGWLDEDAVVLLNFTGADREPAPRARADFLVFMESGGFRVVAASEGERDEHVERVARAVRRVAGVPEGQAIAADTRLVGGGLGLDSVVILELALALEAEFGCVIEPAALRPPHIDTVGSIAELMRRKMAGGG